MDDPRPMELAHDLRNLVGLLRALAAELKGLLEHDEGEAGTVARDLDVYSGYAIEALRVVEKWRDPSPVAVHLGAWAWALRLVARELVVGDLTRAATATVVVPRALDSGRALVTAMGGGRAVHVEADEAGALRFEIAGRAADPVALEAAVGALGTAGLRARAGSGTSCVVEVG
jgi:hypothetical protein